MEVKGKIVEILETVQVSEKFRKREFVIEYAENVQYPEFVKFELIQDKCELLDSFSMDENVTVFFNLKGRKWNDPKGGTKYFNSLQAWKIQSEGEVQNHTNTGSTQESEPSWLASGQGTDDNLPF